MKKLTLALALLVLSACTSAQFAPSRLDRIYAMKTAPDAVQVFQTTLPTKPFEEIGAVSACCSSDVNEMIALLREKASANGGDAIVAFGNSPRGAAWAAVIRY
jgi:hypothetical protein